MCVFCSRVYFVEARYLELGIERMSFPTLANDRRIAAKKNVRGSAFQNIAIVNRTLVQHRNTTHLAMFGPFRLTNPLSGGLLW